MTHTDHVDLIRIRGICSRFPEAEESTLQDRPLFHVRRRRFAIFNDDNLPDRKRWEGFGRSLHFVADQRLLIQLKSDSRFIASPHHGFRGWMSFDLAHGKVDWSWIDELLFLAYRHVANKQLLNELDKSADRLA